MMYLTLGVVIFMTIHLLPTLSTVRRNIVDHFGQVSYVLFFSVISITGMTLIIFGKIEAPRMDIWAPPFWTVLLPVVVMPFVFILLVSTYLNSNIKRLIRHPMLYAVVLWSLVHLFSNGDLASIILFSSFAAYGMVDLISSYKRKRSTSLSNHRHAKSNINKFDGTAAFEIHNRKPCSFSKLNPRTSAHSKRYSIGRDLSAIIIGILFYIVVLYFHNVLFGVSIDHHL